MIENSFGTDWEQVMANRSILAGSIRNEVYTDVICGHDYVVHPGVFPANKFYSTEFFTRELIIQPGEEVLEIGCGMGVTSIELAFRGAARVVATDICERAVRNTVANVLRHGMSNVVEVRQGDLYAPVLDDERFDLIYWNIPFIYVPEGFEYLSLAERSIFDPGYRQTHAFISQASSYLKHHGRLLFGFGDFGNTEALLTSLSQSRFAWKVIAELPATEGRPVRFQLYEATSL